MAAGVSAHVGKGEGGTGGGQGCAGTMEEREASAGRAVDGVEVACGGRVASSPRARPWRLGALRSAQAEAERGRAGRVRARMDGAAFSSRCRAGRARPSASAGVGHARRGQASPAAWASWSGEDGRRGLRGRGPVDRVSDE